MVHMFLNGGGMRGGNLHHLLGGAPFVGPAVTLPIYRLHAVALDGAADDHPALQAAPAGAGAAVEGELYDIDLSVLRTSLLPAEPADLELGVIGLADGTEALGMRLRDAWTDAPALTDITAHGSWRAYLASKTGPAEPEAPGTARTADPNTDAPLPGPPAADPPGSDTPEPDRPDSAPSTTTPLTTGPSIAGPSTNGTTESDPPGPVPSTTGDPTARSTFNGPSENGSAEPEAP